MERLQQQPSSPPRTNSLERDRVESPTTLANGTSEVTFPGVTHAQWFVEWYLENNFPEEVHLFSVKDIVFAGRTRYQNVGILDTHGYGRILVLDGATQSAAWDEYIYHEALVHPAMVAHSNPRKVLMIGGGEGATAREVLRHPTVEHAVMVDIDEELVNLCKTHLTTWHRGAFNDPRLEVVFGDGYAYVAESRETFDVIIIDIVDELSGTPAEALYTPEFYALVKQRLSPDGILVVQSMELTLDEADDHAKVRKNIRKSFTHVHSYCCFVPSFWSEWGFVIAGNQANLANMTSVGDVIDQVLAGRGLAQDLRFYDGITHARMFALPKDLRQELAVQEAL